MPNLSIILNDEKDTAKLAQILAQSIEHGIVFLIGDLGAGKTTLVRYWLHQLGHTGAVKSPTYTLVEPYQLPEKSVYHFDLYRLQDPYELELMGIRDYFQQSQSLSLIEWPSKGEDMLPSADVVIEIRTTLSEQRCVDLQASAEILTAIQVAWNAN